MQALLADAAPREDEIRVAFARSARLGLAGLLVAPALLGLASAAGFPLRAAVDPAFWVGALAGFGGAGWLAGRRLGAGRRREPMLAGVFVAAGVLLTPAFRGLQGLTGHESLIAVAAATLPAFGVAFALVGALAARVLGITPRRTRVIVESAAGGVLGGALAMLPFGWAWLRLDVTGESYLVMALAVFGFLGCLIVPFHIAGSALDRARRPAALAHT